MDQNGKVNIHTGIKVSDTCFSSGASLSQLHTVSQSQLPPDAATELKRPSAANDKADSFMEALNRHCSMTVVWESEISFTYPR